MISPYKLMTAGLFVFTNASIGGKHKLCITLFGCVSIYRVIQEESAIPWEMIVFVILSKKVHMNMGPILDGYGVMTASNLE